MKHQYDEKEGVLYFFSKDWTGTLIVGGGANLVSLRHCSGLNLLRTPISLEEFRQNPEVWGCPVLFPPNRISGARFSYDGMLYELPVNDPNGLNHIHGMLSRQPWEIARIEDNRIVLQFKNSERQDCFHWFPHPFLVELSYCFYPNSVAQEIRIRNTGARRLPFGIGFHTAFRLGFTASDSRIWRQTRVCVTTADFEWERRGFFPTGKQLSHRWDWQSGIMPEGQDVSVHTPIRTNADGFRGAILESPVEKVRVIYEVSPKFSQWVLWNYRGNMGFFCPEPQTWMIDAPNLPLPEEQTGMMGLAPGDEWSAVNQIRVIRL